MESTLSVFCEGCRKLSGGPDRLVLLHCHNADKDPTRPLSREFLGRRVMMLLAADIAVVLLCGFE